MKLSLQEQEVLRIKYKNNNLSKEEINERKKLMNEMEEYIKFTKKYLK